MCFLEGCTGEALMVAVISVIPWALAFCPSDAERNGKSLSFKMYLTPLDCKNAKSASFLGFDHLTWVDAFRPADCKM